MVSNKQVVLTGKNKNFSAKPTESGNCGLYINRNGVK